MRKLNKQTKKTMQTSQTQGFEAILASDGKFSIMSQDALIQEFGKEVAESYRKTRRAEVAQRPDRERVMTAAIDSDQIAINKVAFRIMKNLKHFHEFGRLWENKADENGNRVPASISHSISKRSKKLESVMDWSESGKVKPLSDNDLDEIFLAARAGLVQELENQRLKGEKSLRDAWKIAASLARRELYLVTKEQTFASRTRAETYSAKAREFAWEHYADLADLQGFSVADTLLEFVSEDTDFKALVKSAKQALARRYQAKSCYAPSKMLRSSTLQAIELLNSLVYLIESKEFTIPKRKSNEKKTAIQQALERLALKVREGKDLESAWNKGLEIEKLIQRKKRQAIKAKAQVTDIQVDRPQCVTQKVAIAECGKYGFTSALKTTLCKPIVPHKAKVRRDVTRLAQALKEHFGN